MDYSKDDAYEARRRRLAQELEDGVLRRELQWSPETQQPQAPAATAHQAALVFHGRGSEYFRIWVVHTLLTLLTLGIYSAWAKVRKAQWFARHTELLGDRFDYHGDPWRILLGRVFAVGLLVLWTHLFEFGLGWGLAGLALMCLLAPLLFASAQRFRLANTSWRGLRFAFDVPRGKLYRVCVPALLVWTASAVLAAAGAPNAVQIGVGLLALCFLPLLHAQLKQLQHQHARFGEQGFAFRPANAAFYRVYVLAFLLLVIAGLGTSITLSAVLAGFRGSQDSANPLLWQLIAPALMVLLGLIFVWPYFAARMQQVVWKRTTWGAVHFEGTMRGRALFKLVFRSVFLTLLTLGVYWPFAAVQLARYRVQSMRLNSEQPLQTLVARGPAPGAKKAAGDAAADNFGLDLGW